MTNNSTILPLLTESVIKSIEINVGSKPYKSLKPGFKWGSETNPIPKFSVITGINGSGKTHLLELLNQITNGEDLPTGVSVNVNGKLYIIYKSRFRDIRPLYIPIYYKHPLFESEVNLRGGICADMFWKIAFDKRTSLESFFDLIEKELGKEALNIITNNKRTGVPMDIWLKLEEYINKDFLKGPPDRVKKPPFISSIIFNPNNGNFIDRNVNYDKRNNAIYKDFLSASIFFNVKIVEFEDKLNNIEPQIKEYYAGAELLENLWKKHSFEKFKVKLPVIGDKSYKLSFYKLDKPDESIKANGLSSGEKIILQLINWHIGNLNQMHNMLIIDEFDAHLNPALSKIYIDVINELFVQKDAKVIMTTHSPSTVAYASNVENSQVFWMEEGKIIDKESDQIINDLSDGLITAYDIAKDVEKAQHYVINKKKKYVIFTDGITDKPLLESAIEKQGYKEKFKDVYICRCTGGETIKIYARLAFGQEKTIFLLDNDNKGKKIKPVLSAICKKDKKGRKICVWVCNKVNSEIEDLFPENVLSVRNSLDSNKRFHGNKESFKNYVIKNKYNIDFSGFESLLQKFIEYFEL